jgi:glucose/mannose transport system permease protein
MAEHPVINFVGLDNYVELFSASYWDVFRQSIVNAIFYWIFILVFSLLTGFGLAVLIDHNPRGENLFRTLFLYPFALSFIVTGTIWRWIFLPNGGINILPTYLGLPKLGVQWISETGSVLAFNWQWLPLMVSVVGVLVFGINSFRAIRAGRRAKLIVYGTLFTVFLVYVTVLHWILPPILNDPEDHGFNLATVAIIIAAVWQYAGYTMALYLAGLRGLSESLYEAAKMDGAHDITYYTKIALPNLWPITLSAIIILTHISLKIFALIFAMSGLDNASTAHPAILLYKESFRGNHFATGSAIAVVLFILASLFIIPYLIYLYRQRKGRIA